MRQLYYLILLIFLNGCRSEIQLGDEPLCPIYSLSGSSKGSFKVVYVKNLCNIDRDLHLNKTSIVLTDYEECSPEIKSKNAHLMGFHVLIVRSSSVFEDVVWHSKYDDFEITTLIVLNDCKLSEDLEYQLSVDENPFDINYCIPLIIILQVWNLSNLSYILGRIQILRSFRISSLCLLIELILIPLRFVIFLEPLPYHLFNTHLSYHLLIAINWSLSIGNIVLICYSFWEVISNSKNGLQLIPEYGYFRYVIDRFKLAFLIFMALATVDLIQATLRGLYFKINTIERIATIYYLIIITILAFVYIITYIEILKHNRKIIRYAIFSGVGAGLIIFGVVVFIVMPISRIGLPLKVVTLWSGFLLLSTGNISLIKKPK